MPSTERCIYMVPSDIVWISICFGSRESENTAKGSSSLMFPLLLIRVTLKLGKRQQKVSSLTIHIALSGEYWATLENLRSTCQKRMSRGSVFFVKFKGVISRVCCCSPGSRGGCERQCTCPVVLWGGQLWIPVERPFLLLQWQPGLFFFWLHFFFCSLLEPINCLPAAGNVSL